MSKTRSLSTVLLCLVLAVLAFTLSSQISEAKGKPGGTEVFTRAPQHLSSPGEVQSFDHQPFDAAESCSGACNDTTCVCSGSFECCSLGCRLCWAVLDS